MTRGKKYTILCWSVVTIFFMVYLYYFLTLNGYRLIYQEQTSLFLYDKFYFFRFINKPGGLCTYIGSFIVQFYRNVFVASAIVTLTGLFLYLISTSILVYYRIKGILWSLVPVIFLIALQSDHHFRPGTAAGLLISLCFFRLFISIKNHSYRYVSGIVSIILLSFLTGGFYLLFLILCIIHESSFANNPKWLITVLIYLLISILVPLIFSRLIYYEPPEKLWVSLFPSGVKRPENVFFIALLIYLPLLIVFSKIRYRYSGYMILYNWGWKTIITGFVVISSLIFLISRFVYDGKTEILLGIDHFAQNGDWEKTLEYAFRYPGSNQLVLYYGNMAMYKTGQMGDKMFHLSQAGLHGLWLEWKRNEIAPFFGGELFYQLGYTSEAYRWAFEAMVASGENPRSLKRLVVTSIISGDTLIARHFINILKETLFYRSWAEHYQKLLDNPGMIENDKEIMEKRHFEIHTDILADQSSNDIGLLQMLREHPDNRMAFEYYMAMLLLNKDIDTFADNVSRIKDLGYSHIPAQYEEAILVYMDHTKKNIVPPGYRISRQTIDRLAGYLKVLNSAGSDRHRAAQLLFKDYGGTYWFYMNFMNITGQDTSNQ